MTDTPDAPNLERLNPRKSQGLSGRFLTALSDAFHLGQLSNRDGALRADEFVVKRKLGRSFFTRRLTDKTRRRIAGRLLKDHGEYLLAKRKGWVR
jgi:hypothetical protein